MPCRTGCLTQNHSSWGECARDARLQIGDLKTRNVNQGHDYRLDAFESAVKSGVQPATTALADTQRAVAAADRLGRAPERWEK